MRMVLMAKEATVTYCCEGGRLTEENHPGGYFPQFALKRFRSRVIKTWIALDDSGVLLSDHKESTSLSFIILSDNLIYLLR
jgi:hypothetical protein